MGHYYHGVIVADPETTREELVAAARELAVRRRDAFDDHRNDCVLEWINSTPDRASANLPWTIPWWGNFRGTYARAFAEIMARNNMGRRRTLTVLSVDEEPEGDRPHVWHSDYSTWLGYDDGSCNGIPRCAWSPK